VSFLPCIRRQPDAAGVPFRGELNLLSGLFELPARLRHLGPPLSELCGLWAVRGPSGRPEHGVAEVGCGSLSKNAKDCGEGAALASASHLCVFGL